MKVLVVGSGGREDAIVTALSKSALKPEIICAPGNAGIAAKARLVAVSAENILALVKLAREEAVSLVVVGPEAPLVAGLVDRLSEAGIPAFGPSAAAARLEGSKLFSKELMTEASIPTADYMAFTDSREAVKFIKGARDERFVIKADGLAAGKGVLMCKSKEEALKGVQKIMVERQFGSAGDKIIIEEWLDGEEASFIAVTDGETILPLASSQDHKRLLDDDRGPNTGGMGAYSPAPVVDGAMHDRIMEEVMRPTIAAMRKRGTPFKGILYAGLIITEEGPKVLEFNVRFGDPETQAILPRLKTDLLEIFLAAVKGHLSGMQLLWDERPAVCVVMASEGYPESYAKGFEIRGIEEAQSRGAIVFHAGTRLVDGKALTSGGRVLGVTAFGEDFQSAIKNAYGAVSVIKWPGAYYRKDIAKKALNR